MLRLILLSLALVVTSCPKPPPTMPPKPPPQAPEDVGKLVPPPVSPSPEVRDAVQVDLGGETKRAFLPKIDVGRLRGVGFWGAVCPYAGPLGRGQVHASVRPWREDARARGISRMSGTTWHARISSAGRRRIC